jgi:maltose alpha-D-glucosyltransferase/alpha-amylase
LLWWMKRLIALRQRYQAFGRGTLEVLRPDNRKVFAFIRRFEDEQILVVVNLSRNVQCVELDLSEFLGATPIELFGNSEFPSIGDLPYFITLGPHGFYWFSLESEPDEATPLRQSFEVAGEWEELFSGPALREFEAFLPAYLARRRWFAQKARTITKTSLVDDVPLPLVPGRRSETVAHLLVVQVELDHGSPERYSLPLSFATGAKADELKKWHGDAVLADLRADGVDGVVYDAIFEPAFTKMMVELLARRRTVGGGGGKLLGLPSPSLRQFDEFLADDYTPVPLSAEQSNSSVLLGEGAIVKLRRGHQPGRRGGALPQ